MHMSMERRMGEGRPPAWVEHRVGTGGFQAVVSFFLILFQSLWNRVFKKKTKINVPVPDCGGMSGIPNRRLTIKGSVETVKGGTFLHPVKISLNYKWRRLPTIRLGCEEAVSVAQLQVSARICRVPAVSAARVLGGWALKNRSSSDI
jgi:hypothetical protein